MIRALGTAFLFPLLLVLVWDDAPRWAILVAWGIGFAALGAMWLGGRLVLNCPYCGKGVKIGATHCHHCGRAVTRGS